MKSGQILVYLLTNISNVFLVQCWRLETSSRPFYDFNEITLQRYLSIFSSWYLPFLILSYSPFQKNETLETWHKRLLSNWNRLLNWKGPGAYPQTSKSFKRFQRNIVVYLSVDQVWWVNVLRFKAYIKKRTLPHVLIPTWRHIFGKSMDA